MCLRPMKSLGLRVFHFVLLWDDCLKCWHQIQSDELKSSGKIDVRTEHFLLAMFLLKLVVCYELCILMRNCFLDGWHLQIHSLSRTPLVSET